MTYYIVATCMEKMVRRITHWSTRGFITILGRMNEASLRFAYKQFCDVIPESPSKSYRKDTILARMIKELPDTAIESIMQNYPCPAEDSRIPRLTKLRNLCKKLDSLPPNVKLTDLYNEETCVEFHQFFIAVVIGYGKALVAFRGPRRKYSKKPRMMDEGERSRLRALAEGVWFYANWLWRITESRMLRFHLAALQAGALLFPPLDGHRKGYEEYTMYGVKSSANDQDQDRGEDVIEDYVDDDVEEESRRLISGPVPEDQESSANLALTFQTWLRVLSSHFLALNILTTYHTRRTSDLPSVQISLIGVKSTVTSSDWTANHWETVVRSLGRPSDGQEFDPEVAIQLIKKRMDDLSGART